MSQLAEREIQQLAPTAWGNREANRVAEVHEGNQPDSPTRPPRRAVYVNLAKDQLPVVREAKDAFAALCDKVAHVFSGKPKKEKATAAPRMPGSLANTAYFERLQSKTIKAQSEARAVIKRERSGLGVSIGTKAVKQPMAGAVLAKPELELKNGITKTVCGRVEEVTESDVMVNFSDPQIGWYTLAVPTAQFPYTPAVNSCIEIQVLYEKERGIVTFGGPNVVAEGALPAAPSRTSKLPPEPDDYDDPAQLEAYTAELRKRFRLD